MGRGISAFRTFKTISIPVAHGAMLGGKIFYRAVGHNPLLLATLIGVARVAPMFRTYSLAYARDAEFFSHSLRSWEKFAAAGQGFEPR